MLQIDQNGAVINDRISRNLIPNIEHGAMPVVHGIIVHQTGGSTAASALASYRNDSRGLGAHFLIDRDGSISQTASVRKQCHHVGPLKARCLAENRCSPEERRLLAGPMRPTAESRRERAKQVPDRYPGNEDAIGIELVGESHPSPIPHQDPIYVSVTAAQNSSLAWLIRELQATLNMAATEVFRHPTVSRKAATEASTARW